MKNLILVFAVASAAYLGYIATHQNQKIVGPDVGAAPEIIPGLIERPAESAQSSRPQSWGAPKPVVPFHTVLPPTPAPEQKLAPNHFLLLVYRSVETDAGIVGFPPGTLLTQKNPGKFLTESGQILELNPGDFTDDLGLAAQYIRADRLAQVQARPTAPAPTPTPEIVAAPPQIRPVTPSPDRSKRA